MTRTLMHVLGSQVVRSWVETLEDHIPALRAWHRFEYEQHFERLSQHNERLFSGVYRTREEALRAISPSSPAGYDHPQAASRHLSEVGTIRPSDYPVLFWLKALLTQGASVFEAGGGVGVAFYGFQRYLRYPAGLHWTICEVPAVVELGRKWAFERGARGLCFTSDLHDANGASIFLASGSLHFLDAPPWEILRQLHVKPRHLLLNRIPLTTGPGFVTLLNIGPSICPYQVWNAMQFTDALQNAGYTLMDLWTASELRCSIPFHTDRLVPAYSGMYLRASCA